MSAPTPWTTRQDEVLRAFGHLGAEGARRAIARECGVERSRSAVQMRASRIRVSLRRLETCPECGAVGVRLVRTSGMCVRCTMQAHVEEERAFNELLRLEAEGCDEGPEVEAARREWARLRQANARLARKHGLKGKRGR